MHLLQREWDGQAGVKLFWIIPATLIVDQVSKILVESNMTLYSHSRPIFGEFFRLTYIQNRGAAFGLNLGSPLLHTIVSIVALGVLAWMLWKMPKEDVVLRFALVLVLGGAIGNIIDRLRLDAVIDFFDVGIGTLRWPVFNFADSFVTVGIGLLAFGYSRKRPDTLPEESAPSEPALQPDDGVPESEQT